MMPQACYCFSGLLRKESYIRIIIHDVKTRRRRLGYRQRLERSPPRSNRVIRLTSPTRKSTQY